MESELDLFLKAIEANHQLAEAFIKLAKSAEQFTEAQKKFAESVSELNLEIPTDFPLMAESSFLRSGDQQDPSEGRSTRGRRSKLGIDAKSGSREYARAYYRRNKEKMNERTKKWQRENKERVAEIRRKHDENLKEELRQAEAGSLEEKPKFEEVFGEGKEGGDHEDHF